MRKQERMLYRGKGRGMGMGMGRGRRRLRRRLRHQLLRAQENEITDSVIYSKLAERISDKENRKILEEIANEEKRHSGFWKEYTKTNIKPNRLKIFIHSLAARILGFSFAVKLMEKAEELAQVNYSKIAKEIPEAKEIEKEENEHERKLLGLLDEERLKYVGSMVLGVNDALVELTGALAGLTLALQNTQLIAITGAITGIAASLSMGASEYLSIKAEDQDKDPLKASIYTGGMYVITVILLIIPFFLFSNMYFALGFTLVNALLIILFFTFYISVAQDVPFKKRFFEMAGISLGVSALTFTIGYLVRTLFGIEV
jgi:VIT1/CCC1 family predicted Fe2+/Mn2+ transporter